MTRIGVLTTVMATAVIASAQGQQENPMERNSLVFDYFKRIAEDVSPQLAWNATNPEEHAAWRTQFAAKLRELVGRMPERVPLEAHWDERTETDAFTRHKLYVRSEEHYWVPAYYFVPKHMTGKTPAVICLHGHSGILPYIREGTEAEKKKGREHALDYALYFAEHGYIPLAVVQRGWNEIEEAVK